MSIDKGVKTSFVRMEFQRRKKGESLRRCFTRRVLFIKHLEYFLLTTPVFCTLFFAVLKVLGKGKCLSRWRMVMVKHDVMQRGIENVLLCDQIAFALPEYIVHCENFKSAIDKESRIAYNYDNFLICSWQGKIDYDNGA